MKERKKKKEKKKEKKKKEGEAEEEGRKEEEEEELLLGETVLGLRLDQTRIQMFGSNWSVWLDPMTVAHKIRRAAAELTDTSCWSTSVSSWCHYYYTHWSSGDNGPQSSITLHKTSSAAESWDPRLQLQLPNVITTRHTLSEPPSWGSWGLRWYSSAGKESQPKHNIDHRRHQQPQQGQQSESKAEASVGAGQVLLLWCGTRSRRPHPSDRDWWLTPSFSLSTFTSRPQISPDLYCSGTSSKKLSAVTGGYVLQSCHVFFPNQTFLIN